MSKRPPSRADGTAAGGAGKRRAVLTLVSQPSSTGITDASTGIIDVTKEYNKESEEKVKTALKTRGYALLKLMEPTDGHIQRFRKLIFARGQKIEKESGEPIRSGIIQVSGYNTLVEELKTTTNFGTRIEAIFKTAHGADKELHASNDGLIYWRAGLRNSVELGPPHIDQPFKSREITYQGMLLLTGQNPETGGLAFADKSVSSESLTVLNEGMQTASSKVPSTVVTAPAGTFIIWSSTKLHHGKGPLGGGLTEPRAALLLAYNPAPEKRNSVNRHVAKGLSPYASQKGWVVENLQAAFTDLGTGRRR